MNPRTFFLLFKSTYQGIARKPWEYGQEKAKEIQQNIGRAPIFVDSNSDGDTPKLQFTTGGNSRGMSLLDRHDDPVYEFAYDRSSAIGKTG